MTFQQRKICKGGLISIFIFSFDNAFADKVVINENSCRSHTQRHTHAHTALMTTVLRPDFGEVEKGSFRENSFLL